MEWNLYDDLWISSFIVPFQNCQYVNQFINLHFMYIELFSVCDCCNQRHKANIPIGGCWSYWFICDWNRELYKWGLIFGCYGDNVVTVASPTWKFCRKASCSWGKKCRVDLHNSQICKMMQEVPQFDNLLLKETSTTRQLIWRKYYGEFSMAWKSRQIPR